MTGKQAPPPTLAQMQAFLDRRQARKKARNERRWRQAASDAERIIQRIISAYNPRAIYQWGSVLDRSAFCEISDIDIAVEGLRSAQQFFALLAEAETMTRFPLDIVEMERIEPEYAHLIRTCGRCVYARADAPQGGDASPGG